MVQKGEARNRARPKPWEAPKHGQVHEERRQGEEHASSNRHRGKQSRKPQKRSQQAQEKGQNITP